MKKHIFIFAIVALLALVVAAPMFATNAEPIGPPGFDQAFGIVQAAPAVVASDAALQATAITTGESPGVLVQLGNLYISTTSIFVAILAAAIASASLYVFSTRRHAITAKLKRLPALRKLALTGLIVLNC